jgi:hypothetical protein
MRVKDVALRHGLSIKSIAQLVAGLAVVVLAILGLADVAPTFLVSMATILFGVSLLSNALPAGYSAPEGGIGGVSSGSPTVLLAGVAGVVLGVLALLGASSIQLVAIAVIAFGRSLLIASHADVRFLAAAHGNVESTLVRIVRDTARNATGLQTIAGMAAIVLGILALSGFSPPKLVLIALLELGCFSTLTSAVIKRTFAGVSRPAPRA